MRRSQSRNPGTRRQCESRYPLLFPVFYHLVAFVQNSVGTQLGERRLFDPIWAEGRTFYDNCAVSFVVRVHYLRKWERALCLRCRRKAIAAWEVRQLHICKTEVSVDVWV